MSDLVHYAAAEGVATLTMNRAEKRNALSAEMVTDLRAALARAEADEAVRVVVLTGAGRAFSAGADLAALERLQTAAPEENRADSAHLAGLFAAIHACPKPVIAKVNGHAIAGGCGLAAVCDLSVVAEGAKLGFTEVRIGFVPAIVMVFVVRKIGETAARELFLRGHLIEAGEAASMGLVTRAVPGERLDEEVAALAREIATETSATAVGLTKSMLRSVAGMGLAEGLEYAVGMNAFARGTDDCKAGIAAFLAKRPAPWRRASGTGERN